MWKWARLCKIAALLAFLLPWITVSCSNQRIASASGLDLALGSITFINPISRASQAYHGDANMMLILAAIAIVIGLVFSLRSSRGNAATVLATSCIAFLLCLAATMRIDSRTVGHAAARQDGGFDIGLADTMIRVEYAYGFWIAVIALAGSAIIAWMTLQAGPSDRTPANVLERAVMR